MELETVASRLRDILRRMEDDDFGHGDDTISSPEDCEEMLQVVYDDTRKLLLEVESANCWQEV